jgi:uroporphyrinogen-III synthase
VKRELPLLNTTVVVTRGAEQARELTRLLEAAGASVLELPVIEVVPLASSEAAAAIDKLERGLFAGIVVASANAVRFLHERLVERELTPRAARLPWVAIGQATARAARERGYEAPIVAAQATSAGLLAAIEAAWGTSLAGRHLLLPRARDGREELAEGLRAAGAVVDAVAFYETLPLRGGPALPQQPDWITFASPSAVHAFVGRFGVPKAAVACIGPVTAEAARAAGCEVLAQAREHSAAGLVAALAAATTRR